MEPLPRGSDDSTDESQATLLSKQYPIYQQTGCLKYYAKSAFLSSTAVAWLVSLILLISLALSLSHTIVKVDIINGFWKESEFYPVTREIPALSKQVSFKANLKYNDSHKLYRPIPDGIDYVGSASPQLDAAWDELIGSVEISLTQDEVKFVSGSLYLDRATGRYTGFVTVHHDLHCLNLIRKYVNKDHYPELDHYTTVPHVEHCIDSLRETLMCHGGMTIIPLRWSENRGNKMPDYEVVHTCRDYDALREWSLRRAVETDDSDRNAAASEVEK